MEYSSKTIWLRLKTPIVRDLVSLLIGPAPWLSPNELPVLILLGEDGLAFLYQLDENPESLYTFCKNHSVNFMQLKMYSKFLLSYWFSHAPHCRLLADNIPIENKQQSISESNYIVQFDDHIYYLELDYTDYYSSSFNPEDFFKLNGVGKLLDNIQKIDNQPKLGYPSVALNIIKKLRFDQNQLQYATIIRGMLFVPRTEQLFISRFNPLAWQGYYSKDWDFWFQSRAYFYVFPGHLSLISPVKVSYENIVDFKQVQQIEHGLVAWLIRGEDNYWYETIRIMKVENFDIPPLIKG